MRFTSASIERPAIAALAFAGACLAITLVVDGSELTDAGWTIARPKTVLDAKHVDTADTRIAINQVLEQGRAPLLKTPAQPPGAEDKVEKKEKSVETIDITPVEEMAKELVESEEP